MKLPELFMENTALMEAIDYATKHFKITFFSAPFGSGKTTLLNAYTQKQTLSCQWYDLSDSESLKQYQHADIQKRTLYVFENLQFLIDEPELLQALSDSISASPASTRFLLSSRGNVPVIMNTFTLAHELKLFQMKELLFTREMLTNYLQKRNISLDTSQMMDLFRITQGYPLILKIFADLLEFGYPFSPRIFEQAENQLHEYMDMNLFDQYPPDARLLLPRLAYFKSLNPAVLEYVFHDPQIAIQVEHFTRFSTFMILDANGDYFIRPLFGRYLKQKAQQLVSPEENTLILTRLAEYAEAQNDILECVTLYNLLDDRESVARILEKNIQENHVGAVDYCQLETCYLSLSEEQIANSPSLIAGLSMMHSLFLRVEQSNHYYALLEQMLSHTPSGTSQYYEILRYLIYLQIGLPQRGNTNIVKLILQSTELLSHHEFHMQPMSITGNMPSMMNGGKDFCSWARHDQLLYNLLAHPLEHLFGRYAAGLPDISLGESLFEKNKIGKALPLLTSGISKAELSGTPEMYFAGQGVLIRMMTAQGELSEALSLLDKVETRCKKQNVLYLLPNIHALRTRLYLLDGRLEDATLWLDLESPSAAEQFYIVKRNEYLTRIRVLIMKEKYILAFALIERVEQYAKLYAREYIYMEVLLLKCIILYKMEDSSYQELFQKLLQKTRSHAFIRIIADEGAAVWDLLQELPEQDAYLKQLRLATKRQMMLYPKYLQSQHTESIHITELELDILHLLSSGMTNIEIANSLMMSTHAIKYHLGNIFGKLDAANRTQAVKKAHELGFI